MKAFIKVAQVAGEVEVGFLSSWSRMAEVKWRFPGGEFGWWLSCRRLVRQRGRSSDSEANVRLK